MLPTAIQKCLWGPRSPSLGPLLKSKLFVTNIKTLIPHTHGNIYLVANIVNLRQLEPELQKFGYMYYFFIDYVIICHKDGTKKMFVLSHLCKY